LKGLRGFAVGNGLLSVLVVNPFPTGSGVSLVGFGAEFFDNVFACGAGVGNVFGSGAGEVFVTTLGVGVTDDFGATVGVVPTDDFGRPCLGLESPVDVLVAGVLVDGVLYELPGPKCPAWLEIAWIVLRLSVVRKVSPFHTFGPITPGWSWRLKSRFGS
jgi:hypothetical protein